MKKDAYPKLLEIKDIIRYIKYCKKYNKPYNFLGLVEDRDLTPEVENLFCGKVAGWWDWVRGNDNMTKLIEEVTGESRYFFQGYFRIIK